MLRALKRRIVRRYLEKNKLVEALTYGRSSFAQEAEDLLLWRILEGHHPSAGTYVDVGCNHPWRHSNTAFLYQKGWSGIAIDPNPDFAALFAAERPKDIFLNVGISDFSGKLIYHRFPEPLYNTFDSNQARRLIEKGVMPPSSPLEIAVLPLKDVLPGIWPQGKVLDLLSIDAEGLDTEVVRGHDFSAYPARFVFVELKSVVIRAGFQEPIIELLEQRGYIFLSKLLGSALFIHKTTFDELGFR